MGHDPSTSHWIVHGLAPGHKPCSDILDLLWDAAKSLSVLDNLLLCANPGFTPGVPSPESSFLPGSNCHFSLSLSQSLLHTHYSWAGISPCFWFLVISILYASPGLLLGLPGAVCSLGSCLHSLPIPFLFCLLLPWLSLPQGLINGSRWLLIRVGIQVWLPQANIDGENWYRGWGRVWLGAGGLWGKRVGLPLACWDLTMGLLKSSTRLGEQAECF